MPFSSTDRVALVLLGLLGSFGVLAEEPSAPVHPTGEEIPFLPPDQVLRLVANPIVRMIDGTTCELIGAIWRRSDKTLVGPGEPLAFFRRRASRPFLRVETREDSVVIARFLAKPGETIITRAEGRHPSTGELLGYGKPEQRVCLPAGSVAIGDLEPIGEGESGVQEDQE